MGTQKPSRLPLGPHTHTNGDAESGTGHAFQRIVAATVGKSQANPARTPSAMARVSAPSATEANHASSGFVFQSNPRLLSAHRAWRGKVIRVTFQSLPKDDIRR